MPLIFIPHALSYRIRTPNKRSQFLALLPTGPHYGAMLHFFSYGKAKKITQQTLALLRI